MIHISLSLFTRKWEIHNLLSSTLSHSRPLDIASLSFFPNDSGPSRVLKILGIQTTLWSTLLSSRCGKRNRRLGPWKGRVGSRTPGLCTFARFCFPGQLHPRLDKNIFWEMNVIAVLFPGPTLADVSWKQVFSILYWNGILVAVSGISMFFMPCPSLP